MKSAIATLVLILSPSAAANVATKDENSKQYPITKVVTLLKDMQSQLEKEGEEDEEVYDKMACWCKTNDREKSMSLKEAESRISDLTTTIETTAASSGRLKTEIANEASDLAKSEKALGQLTAMRTKQAAEFNGEEKDMLQSIQALGSAITVLSKHHKGEAFDQAALATISKVMSQQMRKHASLLQGIITPHQKRLVLGAFLQDGQQPNYKPQSSEIFGILRQMKETFEGNLADSQKEELANAKAFEEQKAAKMDEIKAIGGSLSGKQTQLAKSDETNAQSKEDLEDTQNALTIDDEFLIDLKKRCKMTDQEWEVRQKSRQEEIAAIVQAIAILTDDSARDNFSKTLGGGAASFVQKTTLRTARHAGARLEAVRVLKAAAVKTGSPALSGLAVAAQLDAFTKVKAAIDKMVKELAMQMKAEIKEKDYCTDKLNENELQNERQVRKKSDTESKIEGLKMVMSELAASLTTLKSEIAEMNVQIKRAGEDRELANKDFQGTVSDQRETQTLLHKAINVLKAVYTKQAAGKKASLIKANVEDDLFAPPPPPSGFKDYAKNEGGGGAVALLTQILGDAKVLEAEAMKDEQQGQETYEKFVQDTNKAISAKAKSIVNKSQDKAKAEQDMGNSKTDLQQQSSELSTLGNSRKDLRIQCDFLLKNFDVRQQARDEEIEALKQAKAILSGMSMD